MEEEGPEEEGPGSKEKGKAKRKVQRLQRTTSYDTMPPHFTKHGDTQGMESMCQKEIERPEYLRQLIAAKMNGAVKIITGIRRCGKSYLLRKIF